MSRIKGVYAATVKLCFDVDENEGDIVSYDEIKERFAHMTDMMREVITDAVEDELIVTIEPGYSRVWKEEKVCGS